MTELSYLIDLLLNHKLPKATKDSVAKRIQEIQEVYKPHQVARPLSPGGVQQAPSTQAILDRNPDLIPVENIAQTVAASQALASRESAIAASMSGTVDKTTGRPRKF
jgi:hypothetical protein